jgi:serine/threonine protein kinase
MPIIAVEEDYDEVSRLLPDVHRVKSAATISIEMLPSKESEDTDDFSSSEFNTSLASFSNPSSDRLNTLLCEITPISSNFQESDNCDKLVMKDEDSVNDGVESLGSTFELCSIASYADPLSLSMSRSKASYADPLNLSMGRSRRSMDRSIGNSNSSRNRYMIRKKSELNRSIGSSTSSNRKIGYSSMNQSTHSTGSKLADVIVVPKKESIDTKYFVDYSREIGRGTKTIVRKCIERSTGNRYAVKSVRKADIDEYEHMRTEANLLTALDHPSIIKIYDTYEDDKHLHMVVEICKGGELYDHVVKPSKTKKNGSQDLNCPSEEVAAVIVRRVVDAIAYLHEHNIVHRDLKVSSLLRLLFLHEGLMSINIFLTCKICSVLSCSISQLENLLFKDKPNSKNKQSLTDVRVIDFGLSRRYNTHHRFASLPKLTSFVGTKFYVAPEVLNHSYTHAVDLWSIGVLAYALLSAKAPFMGRNDQELFDKIERCGEELKFPSPDFDNVSETAKDFIRQLLVKDEASRPTACELLGHPWMMQAMKWKVEIDAGGAVGGNSKPSVFRKLFGRRKKNKSLKGAAANTDNLDGVTHKISGSSSN